MIRIGATPACWSSDDLPQSVARNSLEQCLKEIANTGFNGIECGINVGFHPNALKRILSELGMVLASGLYVTSLLLRDAYTEFVAAETTLSLLKEAGARILIVREGTRAIFGAESAPLSVRPTLTDDEWSRFLPRMEHFSELVRESGFQLVYSHHMGTVVQSPEEIDRLIAGSGRGVKLLLDTGHIAWAGGDAAYIAKTYAEKIGYIHARDLRPAVAAKAIAEDWSFIESVRRGVCTAPGNGSIDFAGVFKAVPNYSGWVVIETEMDSERTDSKQLLSLAHRNLTRFVDDAGLPRWRSR